jgi:hypothetical protein
VEIPKTKLQAFRALHPETLQSQITKTSWKGLSLSGLEVLHARLKKVRKRAPRSDVFVSTANSRVLIFCSAPGDRQHRINDPRMIRLFQKWLKAGILASSKTGL